MTKIVVESLKRLFDCGKLTKEQIRARVIKVTITEADYEVITGEVF